MTPYRLAILSLALAIVPGAVLAQAQPTAPSTFSGQRAVAPPAVSPFTPSGTSVSPAPNLSLGARPRGDVVSPFINQPQEPAGAAGPSQPDAPTVGAAPSVRRAFREGETARERNDRRAFQGGSEQPTR